MNGNRIKILHCLESIGSGGVEQRRLSIARYLDKQRFDQTLVCAKVKGGFDVRLNAYGTEVHAIGPMGNPFNLKYYLKLFRIIRRVKPDIIHGAVFEGVISAVVGGLFYRVPVVIVEETSEPGNRSWRGDLLMKVLCWFADAVVATSPAVYDYLTKEIGVDEKKAKLILNGAEPRTPVQDEQLVALRHNLNLERNDFVIGFVGRLLNDHKQVTVLLEAFAKIVHSENGVNDLKLLIVGDGPDRQMLEAYAKQLNIIQNVRFVGYQPNTSAYYQLMNVFALVSGREGFGMVVVEAMFFGLPVIGTAVGGIKNIVDDGVTGILVPVKDVVNTAQAIRRLYEDRGEASRMGVAGKQRAFEKFTAERYVQEVEALYNHHLNLL